MGPHAANLLRPLHSVSRHRQAVRGPRLRELLLWPRLPHYLARMALPARWQTRFNGLPNNG